MGGVVKSILEAGRAENYFNSRPRVGGVHASEREAREKIISILAPAWGASPVVRYRFVNENFNSRPRVGGVPEDEAEYQRWLFQFSPPRGGRPDD